MFTKTQFIIFNSRLASFYEGLLACIDKYKINTPLRIAHFLAQCDHESAHFQIFKENLNYSAKALANTWPKRFALSQQKPYVPNSIAYSIQRQPERIANFVYSNRLGNGPIESGDGWKFVGRGAIQLTGRDNYTEYSKYQYGDTRILSNPDVLTKPFDAINSAGWYWKNAEINSKADRDDIEAVTRAVNGGLVGIESRIETLERAKKAFNINE